MTEEITKNIDKLDGMVKIKGKCGYEIIGGCRELRKLKEENKLLRDSKFRELDRALESEDKYKSALEEIRTYLNTLSSVDNDFPNTETYLRIQDKINEVLNDKMP